MSWWRRLWATPDDPLGEGDALDRAMRPLVAGCALVVLALVAGLVIFVAKCAAQQPVAHYRQRGGWTLQDSSVTPGVVRTVDRQEICTGTTKTVRHTTQATKDAVYREYGITRHRKGQFEIDHLIPLELGGADTIANLWPEPATPLPGFHQKDLAENAAHRAICRGSLSPDSAQRWMVHDFPSLYDSLVAR